MQEAVKAVEMHRDLADYIVRIVAATRNADFAIAGCSPRGTKMLFRAAQTCAFAQGRSAVLPDDIKEVAPLTLAHRVVLQRGSRDKYGDKCQLIEELVNKLPVPA
ncbi:MAG: MoxR family ATPase [Planctomycetota bacterium]|nr:MoxR family ATPase [Planctomycetota bacterium]